MAARVQIPQSPPKRTANYSCSFFVFLKKVSVFKGFRQKKKENQKEVEKLKESVRKYAESLKEANNVQFSQKKFDTLKAELKEIDSNAG